MGAGVVVKAHVKVVRKTDFAETHAYCYEHFFCAGYVAGNDSSDGTTTIIVTVVVVSLLFLMLSFIIVGVVLVLLLRQRREKTANKNKGTVYSNLLLK